MKVHWTVILTWNWRLIPASSYITTSWFNRWRFHWLFLFIERRTHPV